VFGQLRDARAVLRLVDLAPGEALGKDLPCGAIVAWPDSPLVQQHRQEDADGGDQQERADQRQAPPPASSPSGMPGPVLSLIEKDHGRIMTCAPRSRRRP